MIIDQTLLDSLTEQAKANPRLRQAFDLRTTPEDKSQRILNAVELGTVLPIHRHRGSTETIVALRGKVVQHYYNENGEKVASYELAPNTDQVAMSVPVGQWHALESLEEGSVIMECKDGSYEPLTNEDILDLTLIGQPTKVNTPCCELYQQLCDSIFGVGAIVIKQTSKDNNIIGTLKYTRDFAVFRKNFKTRLERLRDKFQGTSSYKVLLETVKQVADPSNWEGAYAELVAYDVLHNDYHGSEFQLDVTLAGDLSYASDLGGKMTNEDGYLPDYDLYFDVKCLADTTGNILKELIDEAIGRSAVSCRCDILPEYPLDDEEAEYSINRRSLMVELRDYLKANEPQEGKGKATLISNVLPQLSYRIQWGGGVNSSIGEYSPYEHAEKTKHLILERYTKKFMKNNKSLIVLVNFPWYNNRINSFIDGDELYYRALARRTFCGYKYSSDTMADINPKYKGSESPYEISQHLSGIIFIDDHSIYTDSYSCHTYLNPNAVNPIKIGSSYLHEVVRAADNRSVLDDFRGDNY